jgi:hypothetical protein
MSHTLRPPTLNTSRCQAPKWCPSTPSVIAATSMTCCPKSMACSSQEETLTSTSLPSGRRTQTTSCSTPLPRTRKATSFPSGELALECNSSPISLPATMIRPLHRCEGRWQCATPLPSSLAVLFSETSPTTYRHDFNQAMASYTSTITSQSLALITRAMLSYAPSGKWTPSPPLPSLTSSYLSSAPRTTPSTECSSTQKRICLNGRSTQIVQTAVRRLSKFCRTVLWSRPDKAKTNLRMKRTSRS